MNSKTNFKMKKVTRVCWEKIQLLLTRMRKRRKGGEPEKRLSQGGAFY